MNTLCRILLLNILIFFVQEIKAQTDSLKIWRFVYEVSDVNFKNRGYNDLMNLDVKSDGSSFFYSIYNVDDKISQSSESDMEAFLANDSKKKGAHYKILRDVATNVLTFMTDAPDNFYFKEDNIRIQWNIIDKDTMTVCGYPCK